jgi:imidazolonepropionase-like amidohydrolase
MRPVTLLAGAAALATGIAASETLAQQPQGPRPFYPANPAIAFVNGSWFDGTDFRTRTMYSVDGSFVASLPGKPDTVVDLAGAYVVPPFADAHNHNVEFYGDARARAVIAKYLDAGVFYDQNPLTLERARAGMTGLVNVPTGVDVTWAVGGLTGSGGHPSGLFLRNLKAGVFTAADGEGGFFFAIDSLSDLDRKWPAFLQRRPDFVKTFLLYSEEYAKRRGDSTYFNWRGMNPAVLPEVVRRAHAKGLRVMTHVETAADFHNALVAGVDEIGHMPGFRGNEQVRLPDIAPYIIAEDDAALAAKNNVVVVTTLQQGAAAYPANGPDSLENRQFERLNVRNLGTLKRHGVRLAIGSDNYRETSVPEARYLASVGVFSNAEVLRMWSETTPLAIFPRRKIGRLEPGYEASFLALNGNPLLDFANTGRIRLRVKQGHIL